MRSGAINTTASQPRVKFTALRHGAGASAPQQLCSVKKKTFKRFQKHNSIEKLQSSPMFIQARGPRVMEFAASERILFGTWISSQFARVVKGVDLRSTAGNCAWVRTPQLTFACGNRAAHTA